MDAKDLWSQLAVLDAQVLDLVQKRAAVAHELGHRRNRTEATARAHEHETLMLAHIRNSDFKPLHREAVIGLYKQLLEVFRPLIEPVPQSVACLGPAGSFSHLAASKVFRNRSHYELVDSMETVFSLLREERVHHGVIAFHNSNEGYFAETCKLLEKNVGSNWRVPDAAARFVWAEVVVPGELALLGKGTLDTLASIYTHSRIFRICGKQLERLRVEHQIKKLDRHEVESTSEAARQVAHSTDETAAAIAHPLQAGMWGLNILQESLIDDPSYHTRFLVLGRDQTRCTGFDRTLVCFRTVNKTGALVDALLPIRQKNINMNLITSIPVENEPTISSFFVEFDGHWKQPNVQSAFEEMETYCLHGYPRILGSYPDQTNLS